MKQPAIQFAILVAAVLALAACGDRPEPEPAAPDTAPPPDIAEAADDGGEAIEAFMARIAEHCGEAFEGEVAGYAPQSEDNPFSNRRLVMHVRECLDGELRIPFHVGDDHSRTWLLTRTEDGLRLKHDHRLEDGSEDEITMYGGDTAAPGTPHRQEFPIDQYSVDLYERTGILRSTGNVWAMEIEPGEYFAYEVVRADGSFSRVEFDLSEPVDTPPTPWGWPELDD